METFPYPRLITVPNLVTHKYNSMKDWSEICPIPSPSPKQWFKI